MDAAARTTIRLDPEALRPPASSSRTAPSGSTSLENKARLSEQAGSQQALLGSLSAHAHADPRLAEQLAYDYAQNEMHAIISISRVETGGDGIARYSATWEPVSPRSEARFKQQAAELRAASESLYRSEKRKGTAAADIFDKLIALIGSQPRGFLDAINWGS